MTAAAGRSPLTALIAGLFLAGATTPAAAAAGPAIVQSEEVAFDQYEVVTGVAKHQAVLSGFFLDGAVADLAVVSVEDGGGRLRLFALADGEWTPALDEKLDPGVRFVDVANVQGRDRLLLSRNESLNWFDPAAAEERPLLEVAAPFRAPVGGGIPHVDVSRDLNGDGRDDLVLPDFDGFWISTQADDGAFPAAVKLGPPEPFLAETSLEHGRTYREVGITAETAPWYLGRVHQLDADRDGRTDLAFWNKDRFDVYRQVAHGLFDPVPTHLMVEVPFDSDGLYSFGLGYGDESVAALVSGLRARTKLTMLHGFEDMNGDGFADLVTQSLEGRSLLRLSGSYAVHFGTPAAGGIAFAPEAGMKLRPQGIAAGEGPLGYALGGWQDLDGDGQVEVLFGRVDTGLGGFFRATVGNAIAVDLEFYRFEDGVFPARPNGSRRVEPDLAMFSRDRGPFFPTVLLGDVTGDGRVDLLVGENWEELHVHVGIPGAGVFAAEPRTVRVPFTANEKDARLVDLDRNAKQDLLIHHPSATGPHRVIVLIAR